jgi:ketosteroid isomerase-like protein
MQARALFETWFRRVWRERDLSAIDELRSDDAASVGLGATALPNAQLRMFYMHVLEVFTDTAVHIDRFVEQDGEITVAARFTGRARDGRRVECRGMGFARIVDGKIVEGDNLWDVAALVAQSGKKGTARTLAEAIALYE